MKFKKLMLIVFIINILILNIFINYSYADDFASLSPVAILYNTNLEKVVFSKNADEKIYPASTTKIMTALLVIENCDLESTTIVSENATILPEGYVGGALKVDEECKIKDLLYMLLLESDNNAAIVLAEFARRKC